MLVADAVWFCNRRQKMATVLEGVVVNSVDEDGRFTRICSNPVKVEVIGTASETSLKLYDGEEFRLK